MKTVKIILYSSVAIIAVCSVFAMIYGALYSNKNLCDVGILGFLVNIFYALVVYTILDED